MSRPWTATACLLGALVSLTPGCDDEPAPALQIADGIYATPGEIQPAATAEQRAAFARGEAVARRRWTPAMGLGPDFNVTFCGACHEKPVFGGAAGHYRNFVIRGDTLIDGSFLPGGTRGGILNSYGLGEPSDPGLTRPAPDPTDDTFAVRNPVPFFGVGLIAQIDEAAILANVDPDDADGDGISGRANYDQGFVGRFGMKAQTVSIEGFIRGPLFNHLGLTSDPLPPERQAALPVPSVAETRTFQQRADGLEAQRFHQAAAPASPLTDSDDVADPELSADDLYDLVSWAMLLAAPAPSAPTPQSEAGAAHFEAIGCAACHVPALASPRGLIPLYSDLLLHDMGQPHADGVSMGLAGPTEFRTAPLWGVAVGAPFLHDGSAMTLHDAILAHGGEGARSKDAYAALSAAEQADLRAFLVHLGGAEIATEGLILPGDAPAAGEPGGPIPGLTPAEAERFARGRLLFDRDLGYEDGVGPLFNGDSCRACHFDPVVGGAGPLGVSVARTGTYAADGSFTAPPGGTLMARHAIPGRRRPERAPGAMFELRQTPTSLGLGVLQAIPAESVLALADPQDLDGDGIAGVAHVLPDGRLGRFGWKAQIASIEDFVGDALRFELGITVPAELNIPTSITADDDGVPDPELPGDDVADLTFYVAALAPPMARGTPEPAGAALFEQVGCADCHVPALPGTPPGWSPYTDLLLHRMGDDPQQGVPDGVALGHQYRTPPLWGVGDTAPFMHDGLSATLTDAIEAHAGEAQAARDAFLALSQAQRALLVAFVDAL